MSDLPQGWTLTTFGELFDFKGGSQPPKSTFRDTAAPGYVRLLQIRDFESDAKAVFIKDHYKWPKCSAEDIMIGRYGASVGKILGGKAGAYNVALVRMIFDHDNLHPGWVKQLLRSDHFQNPLANISRSAQNGFNKSDLESINIPLPPLPEQRRIVTKIDSLTGKSRRARDHLDHIPRLVEKYKQAILAAAFRGDLTREWREQNWSACWSESELVLLKAQRASYLSARRGSRLHVKHAVDAVPVPIGWFDGQLADVGRLQVGYAYKSKWYASEGVRLLRGANIAPGQITWDDEAWLPVEVAAGYLTYSLDAGDIVIAMDRPLISSGLKVARIEPEDAGCLLVQRVARYVPSELVEPDYAWHLINSQHFIEHAVTQATGSDLPHISSNDILTTPIPLPCRVEQREIARRVTAALTWIDRLTADATSARKLIDHLDQSVLAKAFKGELVPQDPADEPASALLDRIRAERAAAPKAKRGRKKAA